MRRLSHRKLFFPGEWYHLQRTTGVCVTAAVSIVQESSQSADGKFPGCT